MAQCFSVQQQTSCAQRGEGTRGGGGGAFGVKVDAEGLVAKWRALDMKEIETVCVVLGKGERDVRSGKGKGMVEEEQKRIETQHGDGWGGGGAQQH